MQLVPSLMALQQAQREILELLIEMRVNPASAPAASVAELVSDGPIRKVTLANSDILLAVRRPTSMA